jgi:hypothetical protein
MFKMDLLVDGAHLFDEESKVSKIEEKIDAVYAQPDFSDKGAFLNVAGSHSDVNIAA